jgi:hypothetical protein
MKNKFLSDTFIDLRARKLTLSEINTLINNNKISLDERLITKHRKSAKVVFDGIAQGYPLDRMAAQEDIEGRLTLYITEQFDILLKFYKNKISYKKMKFENCIDGGFVESLTFEVYVIKPSQKNNFSFDYFK